MMKKSQTNNKVFAIQKMSDDGLAELIKDLKEDKEHLEFVYTARKLSSICTKENFVNEFKQREEQIVDKLLHLIYFFLPLYIL